MSEVKVDKVTDASDRSLPIFAEFEKIADKIRLKAWQLFSRHGAREGRALDDWLAAERAVCWPTAELSEHNDVYTLKVALAGFRRSEIEVAATAGEVMIKAAREQQASGDEGRGVKWSEFHSNDVFRRVEFPEPVNVEEVTANHVIPARATGTAAVACR